MPEVFRYPMTFPSLWLDYYYIATWTLGMLFLCVAWAVFYRYGKFTYAVNLGCFWKIALLLVMTTISLGAPQYYNTRFDGEYGQDGDSIKISGDKLFYLDRYDSSRNLLQDIPDFIFGIDRGKVLKINLSEITAIHQESVTYNPPPKIYIVAGKSSVMDSLFVTRNLPGYKRFLSELSRKTGIEPKLR